VSFLDFLRVLALPVRLRGWLGGAIWRPLCFGPVGGRFCGLEYSNPCIDFKCTKTDYRGRIGSSELAGLQKLIPATVCFDAQRNSDRRSWLSPLHGRSMGGRGPRPSERRAGKCSPPRSSVSAAKNGKRFAAAAAEQSPRNPAGGCGLWVQPLGVGRGVAAKRILLRQETRPPTNIYLPVLILYVTGPSRVASQLS
jgi:hypothetical protein